MRCVLIVILAVVLSGRAAAGGPDRETGNVAAFARLYGAVRWFHPSDAAQDVDWNRFAVHGVERVRGARSARALRRELQALFAPVAVGVRVHRGAAPAARAGDTSGAALVRWLHAGFGGAYPYASQRLQRPKPGQELGYSMQYQIVQPAALRGRDVRLRGRIRAVAGDAAGGAALSLHIVKSDWSDGFSDEMKDRRVRDPQWREYTIEGRVDDDAKEMSVGVVVRGAVEAAFDAIVLETRGPDGAWTAVDLAAPGFESALGWTVDGTTRTARWSRRTGDAPEGRHALHVVSAASLDEPLFDLPEALRGAQTATVALTRGLTATVPLTLTDAEAQVVPAQRRALDALQRELAALPAAAPGSLAVRYADVVVAWNVFRHFYPYWDEAAVDWDAELQPLLRAAAPDADAAALLQRMQHLGRRVRDGHVRVLGVPEDTAGYSLPVALRRIGDALVVVGSTTDGARVGDVVRTIDGVPASSVFDDYYARTSGTDHWRRALAARRMTFSLNEETRRFGLERDGRTFDVELTYSGSEPTYDHGTRPAPLTELATGIWYVDLTRLEMEQIAPRLDVLAKARAVVFDVRGYPTGSGYAVLPHLLDAAEHARWMHVPQYAGPFGTIAGYQSVGWDLAPKQPHIGGRRVFLTDARAISYAESVMGYVRDHALGEIVGATTAGANGNVVSFETPSGLNVRYTGMRVTRHDGTTPFHLQGVEPTVAVEPTLEGIRAGRDEVLERALEIVQAAQPDA